MDLEAALASDLPALPAPAIVDEKKSKKRKRVTMKRPMSLALVPRSAGAGEDCDDGAGVQQLLDKDDEDDVEEEEEEEDDQEELPPDEETSQEQRVAKKPAAKTGHQRTKHTHPTHILTIEIICLPWAS